MQVVGRQFPVDTELSSCKSILAVMEADTGNHLRVCRVVLRGILRVILRPQNQGLLQHIILKLVSASWFVPPQRMESSREHYLHGNKPLGGYGP